MFPVFSCFFLLFPLLFFGFLLRTFLRQFSTYTVTQQDLKRFGLFKRTLSWDKLNDVNLKYFSTRRDRKAGWYQLTLSDGIVKVAMDSELIRFNDIMKICSDVVRQKRIIVSETTSENFTSSGFSLIDQSQAYKKTTDAAKDG